MRMKPRTLINCTAASKYDDGDDENGGESKNDINHPHLLQHNSHCNRRHSVLHKNAGDNNDQHSHLQQIITKARVDIIVDKLSKTSRSPTPPTPAAVRNEKNGKIGAQQRRRTLFLLATLTFTAISTQFTLSGVCVAAAASSSSSSSSSGNVNSNNNFHLQTLSSSQPLYQAQPLLSTDATPKAAALLGGGGGGFGVVAASSILDFSPNCSAVVHVFENRGIPLVEIPQKPSNEMVLRYCESPSVGTCCTYSMETKMAMSSRLQLEKQSKEQIAKLSSIFSSRAQKFNEIFNQLLTESKKEFHAMFKRTYGVIYEQNAYVFSDLFNELEKYYSRGRVDLAEAMDSFFNTLYQKMFTVLNAQYSFDDKYLGCVSEHMKELKPFGDVPDKLSVQIKRSFVATRTFAQALMTAADVTKKVVNIRLNADCTAALTKMQHCGACKGYAEKPCVNYCVNVIKGCLHYFHELDIEWDNYVLAMEKVAERLLGSFNIVMVVEPINIKISEAIMNFQESGQDISNRVFQGCGRPSLGRRRRSINSKFLESSKTVKKRIVSTETIDFLDADDILDIDAKLENEIVLRERRAADPGPKEIKSGSGLSSVRGISDGQGTQRGGGSGGNRRNRKKQQNKKNEDKDYSSREPVLDRQIKEIRQKVKESKKFWSNLPHQFCNNEEVAATSAADNNCWNGHTVDRYMHSITTEHGSNPEFPGNPTSTRQSSAIATQLYYLKIAINHLRNAYNGLDVDWTDQEDPYYGSGSGSGGGSDDEDDDEGSGISGPFPPSHKPGSTGGGLTDKTDHPAVRVNNIDDEDDSDVTRVTSSGPKHGGGGGGAGSSSDNNNDEDDDDDENRITRKKSKENSGDSGATTSTKSTPPMTLRRALFLYLVPLYVAWFGGIVSDLL